MKPGSEDRSWSIKINHLPRSYLVHMFLYFSSTEYKRNRKINEIEVWMEGTAQSFQYERRENDTCHGGIDLHTVDATEIQYLSQEGSDPHGTKCQAPFASIVKLRHNIIYATGKGLDTTLDLTASFVFGSFDHETSRRCTIVQENRAKQVQQILLIVLTQRSGNARIQKDNPPSVAALLARGWICLLHNENIARMQVTMNKVIQKDHFQKCT
mmetsp:Transcript_4072/g.9256  ORF Transcript_4072/g.9256 Transcript_4072/m.9256 type:complete len:212 (+) Transcript_4072:1413-2048(+)